jgi:hypothetical protein
MRLKGMNIWLTRYLGRNRASPSTFSRKVILVIRKPQRMPQQMKTEASQPKQKSPKRSYPEVSS